MSSRLTMIDHIRWFREVLEENSHFLVDNLDYNARFNSMLVSRQVLKRYEVEDLERDMTRSEKAWMLVKLLQKKGYSNFCTFLDCLEAEGQEFIADTLIADIKYKANNNATEQNAEQKVKILMAELEGQVNLLKKEKQDHEITQKSLKEMNKYFKEGQADIEKLKREIEKLQIEYEKLQIEYKKLQKEKETFEVQAGKSRYTIKELEEKLAKLQQQLDKAMSSIIKARTNHQLQKTESDELREVREAHQKEKTSLTDQVAKLQTQIKELKREPKYTTRKVYGTSTYLSDSGVDGMSSMSSLDCLDQFEDICYAGLKRIKQKVSEEKWQQLPSAKGEKIQQETNTERQARKDREENIPAGVNKRTTQDALTTRTRYELMTPSFPTGSRPNSSISRTTTNPLLHKFMEPPPQPQSPKKWRGSPGKRQEFPRSSSHYQQMSTLHTEFPHRSSHYQQVKTLRREFPPPPAAMGNLPTVPGCTTAREHPNKLYNPRPTESNKKSDPQIRGVKIVFTSLSPLHPQ